MSRIVHTINKLLVNKSRVLNTNNENFTFMRFIISTPIIHKYLKIFIADCRNIYCRLQKYLV